MSAANLLAGMGDHFRDLAGLELEFSIRLEPGKVEPHGRFCCWTREAQTSSAQPITDLLRTLGAPEVVRAQQADGQLQTVCNGVGVASDGASPEFRFYRHSRVAHTGNDRYDAWRWSGNGAARRSLYRFAYLPETAEGERPASLVPEPLRLSLDRLLEEPRVQAMSGFWIRTEEDGRRTQLDLQLPWYPAAGSLEGVRDLLARFQIAEEDFAPWLDLHIKHIAFRLDGTQSVTLYASAAADGWPADEEALQAQVRRNAQHFHRALESEVFAHIPAPQADLHSAGDVGSFYDGPISQWKRVLGAQMHYHGGLFSDPACDPSDEEAARAMSEAVRALYPLLPAEGSVYDVGCGWGGPLAMLTAERGLSVTGLTVSRVQYQHLASLGYRVRWGDAETTLPPGAFHAAFLLESLCHVRDKERVLRTLRVFCGRLVMRVNCQDASPPAPAFGGSMQMISSSDLRNAIESAGWRIRHWRDCRMQALPSVRYWHRRLSQVQPTADVQIEVLRKWCQRVLQEPETWARNNPLIEVMAE